MSAKITLTVTEGKLRGEQFCFKSRDTCIIGRHKDCQIQIPDDKYHNTISRYHCLLDINPPDIEICDLGSRHGTYVNGKCIGRRSENQTALQGTKLKLAQYKLGDGDVIRISNTAFRIAIELGLESTWIIRESDEEIFPRRDINVENNLGLIDRYTKIELLGQGSFGKVYLVRLDDETGRKFFALKTLRPELGDKQEMKQRFLREARNTKSLAHPNIVRFNDFGETKDLFYFTMEYCNRGSVEDLMKKRGGKIKVEEATEIILQILDALDFAHHRGLVHRDIKPANIFLTVDKNKIIAKLGDYGLAKSFMMAGMSGLTNKGQYLGSPAFTPRQQVIDSKYVKPDVDIWAVAATYYFMLTGTPPKNLKSSNPFKQTLEVQKEAAVPIRERNAYIPQSLAKLIDIALVDNPELHFKNALAFKKALLSVRE